MRGGKVTGTNRGRRVGGVGLVVPGDLKMQSFGSESHQPRAGGGGPDPKVDDSRRDREVAIVAPTALLA